MSLDATKNFAKVTVSTGYGSGDISIVLATGAGAKLPQPSTDGAFNLVWWDSASYGDPSDDPNVEIVRVTARTTDTLTVIRGQEATPASNKNTSAHTYLMILGATAKMFTDIQSALASAGAISSVSNTDGTLTINPTTGAVVASLALGHANTWTGAQTFGDALLIATTPKFTTGIKDANGNIIIGFTATGSAVDYLLIANAATANPSMVILSAAGASTNISLQLLPKGSGVIWLGPTSDNNYFDRNQSNYLKIYGGNHAFIISAWGQMVPLRMFFGPDFYSPCIEMKTSTATSSDNILNHASVVRHLYIEAQKGETSDSSIDDAGNIGVNLGDGRPAASGTNNGGPASNFEILFAVGGAGVGSGTKGTNSAVNYVEKAHGARSNFQAVSILLASSAGGTLTATNLIPAGSTVLSCTSRVTTAFGTSNGLTSISIGDGTIANLFSNNSAITLASVTNSTNYLSTFAPKFYPAATSIMITGNGGTGFDATGAIRITLWYFNDSPPTS